MENLTKKKKNINPQESAVYQQKSFPRVDQKGKCNMYSFRKAINKIKFDFHLSNFVSVIFCPIKQE